MGLSEKERRRIYEEEKARVEGRKKGSRKIAFWVIGLLLAALYVASRDTPTRTTTDRPPTTESSSASTRSGTPMIEITIRQVEYESRAFKVSGTAVNTGNAEAFSPTIKLYIYDENQALVAEDTDWPTGQFMARMQPGTAAGFDMIAFVPQHTRQVWWKLIVNDVPYDVKFTRTKDSAGFLGRN